MFPSVLLSVIQGLLKMKLLPRLRYILEVVRPSPRVVQDVLGVLTRIARHSSSSSTQVTTATASIHLRHSKSHNQSYIDVHISLWGAGLSPPHGNGTVQLPVHFMVSTTFSRSSLCLWTPAVQRHEAHESFGFLWQTRVCQTGRCTDLLWMYWFCKVLLQVVLIWVSLCILYILMTNPFLHDINLSPVKLSGGEGVSLMSAEC